MIGVLFPAPSADAGRLVIAALRRSVSATQAHRISPCPSALRDKSILVAVDAPDMWGDLLLQWLDATPGKLLIFGRIPALLAQRLGCVRTSSWPESMASAARSAPAMLGGASESGAIVQYTSLATSLGADDEWVRPFERFDFADEWNNLGFGAIRSDRSVWSVQEPLDVPVEARLASVHIDGARAYSYGGLWELGEAGLLWFNRSVGPCDSFEWRLIENFLSAHRASRLPCQPVLSEIPWGYDAAITSRMDCDECVESVRALWHAYQRLGIPFSLAVHTSNLNSPADCNALRELASDRSTAILSHSATHASNWGGSYDAALSECIESKQRIEAITGRPVRYAVSPFHQNPAYALEALSDAGYEGCVGGIIRNDPEFLIARGGMIANMPSGFIGHSQQTMFHGDCLLADGDPLETFKRAFDIAYQSKTLFGYLDHPFSKRYQYGWSTEAERIDAHEQLIAYISVRASKPLFMNEDVALDFLLAKSKTNVMEDAGKFRVQVPQQFPSFDRLPLSVEFRGERVAVDSLARCI